MTYQLRALFSILVTTILLSLCGSCTAFADAQVAVKPNGETLITSKTSLGDVRVKIETQALETEPAKNALPVVAVACTGSRKPCTVVTRLDIERDSKRIIVPRSVLSGLADLTAGEIQTRGEHLLLVLRGGDASESYVTTLEFDDRRVTRSSVASGMDTSQLLQETIFHEAVVGD